MTHIAALIVAAGSGSRLGGLPKQYRLLSGKSVLRHVVDTFKDVPTVQVVIGEGQQALYKSAMRDAELLPPVLGGTTRQSSVRLGLEALAPHAPDIVLIHDAARALVSQQVIADVIAALKDAQGAAPAMPISDSLIRLSENETRAVSRENLFAVQTPQAFRFADILAAHRSAEQGFTDDISIAQTAGLSISFTPGCHANFKLTVEGDLERAEMMLTRNLSPRTGMGFDVHRFGVGDHVWLCGVKIPHTNSIIAHSDGDVALHALTDAILGAISAGDIGLHFPPSDLQWKNAPSRDFLAAAKTLVEAQNGVIAHVDVTVICERPKITLHREAMRQSIAEILQVDTKNVSVKATTTEQLGFTGRGEGIAAQAIATVLLP
jgi:2-C-methyl-D-erythritol 4-phosphate cytidylyltransferase / 2-C-methyl-D-erythritol 2,4-cyclodiphosphate synthase